MERIRHYIGVEVEVEISGKTTFAGILIDTGLDVIILFDGQQFLYIPLLHVHNLKEKNLKEITAATPESLPFQNENEDISYRKVLNNAKGRFLEIFVTGNRSIHGYVTNVLNDYIVFFSPVYKTMFVSMQHLKWLTPYTNQLTPYTLDHDKLPVVPSSISLHRSFEDQLKKYKNQLVVFDMGDHPNKVGLLKNVSSNIIELITANGESMFLKMSHIKTIHIP